MSSPRPIKVLIAKPGLDGHDVGAKLLCRALIDAGMEVIYTGLRQTAESIVNAAVQEDVDVVGLSVLSGAHLPLIRKVIEKLKAAGAGEKLVIAGGNIPAQDFEAMAEIGVAGVFPTSTPFKTVVSFLNERVQR